MVMILVVVVFTAVTLRAIVFPVEGPRNGQFIRLDRHPRGILDNVFDFRSRGSLRHRWWFRFLFHRRLCNFVRRERGDRFCYVRSARSWPSLPSKEFRSRRARFSRSRKGESVVIVVIITRDLRPNGTVGTIESRGVRTGVEPNESPGGVDGRLPASAGIEVFAQTWQVGLGGRGVDGEPLWPSCQFHGDQIGGQPNTHVIGESNGCGRSVDGIGIQ